MLIVLPAAMIIIAIAIDKVWEILGIQWQKDKKVYGFVTGAFLLSLLVLNIWTYYVDFLGNCLYGESERGRFASYLGRFVAASNQDVTIFLLSDNEYYYVPRLPISWMIHTRSRISRIAWMLSPAIPEMS